MSLFDLSDLKEDYDWSLKKFGPGPKALLWWDYRSMAIRFRELVRLVPVEGKTIMDAGCGLGDLLPYLYAKSVDFRYVGYDIKPEFIVEAKKHFRLGLYDVVISSGVMNGNVKNWLEKRQKMITNLFDQTGEVLAFNMAGGAGKYHNDSLMAYANADEILEFCKTLTPHTVLNTQYLHNDFTIVMFKKKLD
jgi:SAM-dependent methyltransferase